MSALLRRAARVLAAADRLREQQRAMDARIVALCREYGDAAGVWCVRPEHLRAAVQREIG